MRRTSLCRLVSYAVAGLFGAMVLMNTNAQAAETLKLAHVYETSNPFHTNAVWAAEELEKRTDGRYEIEVYPASALGKEADLNEGLTLGTVDIIYTGPSFASRSYGPLAISDAPYMFRGLDHWKAYAQSDLFRELAGGYREQTGNKIASLAYYGMRHVTSNEPIDTPDDMKGLKIRVPNAKLYMMFPQAVDANPTPIAFAEVYLALQQGTVDAQENPLPTIKAKRFYEVQDYIDLTGHMIGANISIISGQLWERLDEKDRDIFMEVFDQAAQKTTQAIEQSEKELISWFEEQGTTVNEVDRKPFREAVIPSLTGDAVPWSKETYDRLQAIGQ